MSNKLYDILMVTAQVTLPAFGTLYAALGAIWGWGNIDTVVSSIVAIDTFLGSLLKYYKVQYDKENKNINGDV